MANNKQHQNRKAPGLGNYAVRDKLQNVSSQLHTRRSMEEVKKVTDLGADGEDHINVYLNCKTALGKALSPFEIKPFVHRFFGKFNSRQGLYYYLLSKDGHEAFRTMHPIKMRSYAATLSTMGHFAVNLRYHMADALWSQIKNDDVVKQQLIDNQLPFEAYFLKRQKFDDTVSMIPARPNNNAGWITRIVTVIAIALKKGVAPNFDEFIDNQEQLDKLTAKITRPLTPPPTPKVKKEKVKKEVTDLAAQKGRGLTSSINHVDEAGYQSEPSSAGSEVAVVNVVHNALAFKSVPGKGWIASMPETTPLEALSAAVDAEASIGKVDNTLPPGVEGGPALTPVVVDGSPLSPEEAMEAVKELREALIGGTNGTSTEDLANTSIAPHPGEVSGFVDPLVQTNTNCVLGQEPDTVYQT